MKCEELTEKCKVGSVTYKVWIFKFELNWEVKFEVWAMSELEISALPTWTSREDWDLRFKYKKKDRRIKGSEMRSQELKAQQVRYYPPPLLRTVTRIGEAYKIKKV